jgi:hypothetical protein
MQRIEQPNCIGGNGCNPYQPPHMSADGTQQASSDLPTSLGMQGDMKGGVVFREDRRLPRIYATNSNAFISEYLSK